MNDYGHHLSPSMGRIADSGGFRRDARVKMENTGRLSLFLCHEKCMPRRAHSRRLRGDLCFVGLVNLLTGQNLHFPGGNYIYLQPQAEGGENLRYVLHYIQVYYRRENYMGKSSFE